MKAKLRSIMGQCRWASLFRVVSALFSGGIFYGLWLAVVLGIGPQGRFIEITLWVVAPLVTGLGFAVGIAVYNRLRKEDQGGFLQIFIWTVTGCTVGALALYWSGPMLIVFSMLFAGMLSVWFREVVLSRLSRND